MNLKKILISGIAIVALGLTGCEKTDYRESEGYKDYIKKYEEVMNSCSMCHIDDEKLHNEIWDDSVIQECDIIDNSYQNTECLDCHGDHAHTYYDNSATINAGECAIALLKK